MFRRCSFALLTVAALAGCAVPSPAERRDLANKLAAQAGWQAVRVSTDTFTLAAYLPVQEPQAPIRVATDNTYTDHSPANADALLTIYIEGDGRAWISRSQASRNPTPTNPIALKLALNHSQGVAGRHAGNVSAYLARPCQFVSGPDTRNCSTVYWTDKRFAPEVVSSMNQAVAQLKARAGAQKVALVGYSGGGAIAALIAARRTDVSQLITIAGNLDTEAWTNYHGVPPLTGSLNPADAWGSLQDLMQFHFVGSDDRIVPEAIVQSYLNRYPAAQRPQLQTVKGFNHHCCWDQQWQGLDRINHR